MKRVSWGGVDSDQWPAGTVKWFCYVRQEDRARYEAAGWTFAADLGPTHGCAGVV